MFVERNTLIIMSMSHVFLMIEGKVSGDSTVQTIIYHNCVLGTVVEDNTVTHYLYYFLKCLQSINHRRY